MNSLGRHLNSMENPSDLDTSSESECNSDEGSTAVSDCDEDEHARTRIRTLSQNPASTTTNT